MLQLHENTQLQELILKIQSNSISQIDLRDNLIGDEEAKALAQALKENHSILQIELGENQIGVEGAKAFAEALIENHSITYIDLSANGIGDGGAKALAQTIKKKHSITQIELMGNQIGDEGAKALAEALKENHHISYIGLDYNYIGTEGAKALAQAFKENYSISRINLDCNLIGDEGAKALAEALTENHSITQIELVSNQIGDEGAKALAQAFKENYSISYIGLEDNQIREGGAIALAEALKENHSITTISLGKNQIGDGGAKVLVEALKKNHIITEINFDTDQIGPEEAEALAKALEKNKVFLDFAISKLSQEKVVLSDVEMYTLKAHIKPRLPYSHYKDQYDKYLENIIPKMEYLFHNQDKIAKRAVSIPLIANEMQQFFNHEDFCAFRIGSIINAYALTPAIKCLTDIVSGKNLDQKLSDYYQVAISANSRFSFVIKEAVIHLIYQASSQNNFGIVNSMIASKLVCDAIDTSYNLITGNKINDNVTISEYSTETLAYIAKMSAANVMNYAFLSHYGACDIYSSTEVNMALPLGELGLAIVYKSGEILDHLLNPNGNHIDFDYYL